VIECCARQHFICCLFLPPHSHCESSRFAGPGMSFHLSSQHQDPWFYQCCIPSNSEMPTANGITEDKILDKASATKANARFAHLPVIRSGRCRCGRRTEVCDKDPAQAVGGGGCLYVEKLALARQSSSTALDDYCIG